MRLIAKDLPKGTPLVVNGLVYRFFLCKMFVEQYLKDDDLYRVVVAEDHLDADGHIWKKGFVTLIGRDCFFDKNDVDATTREDIGEFLLSGENVAASLDIYSHHDMVQEALLTLEMKLKRSRKRSDQDKLEYLRQNTSDILLRLKQK